MLRPHGRVSTPWVSNHDYIGSVQTCTDVRADVDVDGTVDAAGVAAVKAGPDDPVELTYSALDNPYFFTGRTTDTLHADKLQVSEDPEGFRRNQDNRNRTYDPKYGRWLQRDPLGCADEMNLYEYAGSRPTFALDPMGRISWPIKPDENEACFLFTYPCPSPVLPDPPGPGSKNLTAYGSTAFLDLFLNCIPDASSPSRFAGKAKYKCKVRWYVYDYYDFMWLQPYDWGGTPFHILGRWIDTVNGLASMCERLPPASQPE